VSTSREEARDRLVNQLTITLGANVKTVTGVKLDDLKGKAPIVYVATRGTERKKVSMGIVVPDYYFDIIVYVLRDGFTDIVATDSLENIESLISDTVKSLVTWDECLKYNGRSVVTEWKSDERNYYRESVPVIYSLMKE